MPLAPQKEANGREEAVLEWVALEAVAVNVRQALELEVTAEAVLDGPAAVVLGLVLRERVLREQAHRDRVHREAVPQELGVLAQRVQVDLAEVENLVIEADKCNGHDSCADALH
jgi:glycine cleavage system pyridoxal-binding protein P